jgi:hypothetical protein
MTIGQNGSPRPGFGHAFFDKAADSLLLLWCNVLFRRVYISVGIEGSVGKCRITMRILAAIRPAIRVAAAIRDAIILSSVGIRFAFMRAGFPSAAITAIICGDLSDSSR